MMNIANSVLWLLPLVLVGAGFLLSGVKKFRFGRLGGMVAVFLAAFLQDLQATSFRNDTLDSIFSLFVLMVFTDLFWRIIRLKTKIVRVVGLLTGIILFTVFYGDWISGGPKNIFTKHSAKIISEYKNGKQAYFIKRRPAPQDTVTGFEYVLFKERGFSFFVP